MKDARPDIVLSGVNRGGNLGTETVFSGTVGAAMTSMLVGVPAIALSQAFTDRNAVPWDTRARLRRTSFAGSWPPAGTATRA